MIKAYQIAIDLRDEILSAQGIKSRNQKIHLTGDRQDDTLPEARRVPPWQGRRNAARALRQGLSLAPFPLVPIKTPLGSKEKQIQSLEHCCYLVFRIVVAISFFF